MARPHSPRSIRRHAIDSLKTAIRLAIEKGDHAAAGAFAVRLEQMASRLARDRERKVMAPSLPAADSRSAQGLRVGSRPE